MEFSGVALNQNTGLRVINLLLSIKWPMFLFISVETLWFLLPTIFPVFFHCLKTAIIFALKKKCYLMFEKLEINTLHITYTIEENDLVKCLDVLCGLLNNRSLRADSKCKEKYTEISDLKSKMKRANSVEISEIKSNLYSLVCLHHDKPDIVMQKAEDILSNKPSTFVRKQRHRRYDLLLLYICVLFYQFKMQWNSTDDITLTGNFNEFIVYQHMHILIQPFGVCVNFYFELLS